jgi:dihydroneopterin aldolase
MNLGEITIHGLDLPTHIGVPEEERAQLQVLRAHVTVQPQRPFSQMEDSVEHTIDYAMLTLRLRAIAMERPRKLLETLANELAEVSLKEFGAGSVRIELEKKILPGVDHVSVSLKKSL